MEFSLRDAGVRVGLEIHQQLDTGRKLFCKCAPADPEEHPVRFQRVLRASRGETGRYDAAALFEESKARTVTYLAGPGSSCLVERDEEPPHDLDPDARQLILMISCMLHSRVFEEVYPMRKTVVDGSNTSGFQRTMLVAQGGHFEVGGRRIGIQSVCLEEDAAKILDGGYGLERLGVPLAEIATEPFAAERGFTREVAQGLGRILRSTKRVRRGLGTIRQDVNVSIRDGNGVIEVKGVQQLDMLEKIVEFEAARQTGMLDVSRRIKESGWVHDAGDRINITEILAGCGSKVVARALEKGHEIWAVSFGSMAGIFGYTPYEGVRLGREVAWLAKLFGIGGIFHSDELPGYGITEADVGRIRKRLKCGTGDAFIVSAVPGGMADALLDAIVGRIESVRDDGIPADTRLATQDGQTAFLRPKPGAARMYPETDIPPLYIAPEELGEARDMAPKSWDDSVRELQELGISAQLAEQVYDSRHADLFLDTVRDTNVSPAFIASALCYTITSLERDGLDSGRLSDEMASETFGLLDSGRISKESVEIIFREIMAGKSRTVQEAIDNASLQAMDSPELRRIIGSLVEDHMDLVRSQGERAIGPLMGMAMGKLRGKASGQTINDMLSKAIRDGLE